MRYKSINNRVELIAYIKRQLGSEGHELELTNDNIKDSIDDAVEYFLEIAYDGSDEHYEEFDLVEGQTLYHMDDEILAVVDIMSAGYGENRSNQVAWESFYSSAFAGMYNGNGGGMLNYALTQNYINSLEDIIKKEILFSHNQTTNELRLYSKPTSNMKVLLQTIRYPGENTENFDCIYGHRVIKLLATGYAFLQWYRNVFKYNGAIFDGNIELNKEAFMIEGKELIEKAEEIIKNEYRDSFGLIYK